VSEEFKQGINENALRAAVDAWCAASNIDDGVLWAVKAYLSTLSLAELENLIERKKEVHNA
jgi:hypothetical protein